MSETYVMACCLFCHDKGRPHEFKARLSKRQKYHGCDEGRSFSAKTCSRKVNYELRMERRLKAEKVRQGIYKEGRVKGNKKLCPICHEVYTVNYYACVRCQRSIGDLYELDSIITFQSGSSRHIRTGGSTWATS